MKKNACLLLAILLWVAATVKTAPTAPAPMVVLVEAEAFQNPGGWVLDQQFMDQMGSPYLLAHGLGDPVKDAETTVKIEKAGTYKLWVRTKDWVAQWNAPGTPGKFQILIDDRAAPMIFGTEGAQWHWQDGGSVELPAGEVKLALHDLTGFEGRCDAILFSADPTFTPPNEPKEMAAWRRVALGFPEKPQDAGAYDLVVAGGGFGGMGAALSAARLGLKVALVQDRPVLGGNASGEVCGGGEAGEINIPPYGHVGDVVRELCTALDMPRIGNRLWEAKIRRTPLDRKREALMLQEKNITLFLNYHVNETQAKGGLIRSIVAQNIISGERIRLSGKLFADCTGDGAVGFLAGADFEVSIAEGHMGPTNTWSVINMRQPVPFPRCPWALGLSNKPFLGREAVKPSPAAVAAADADAKADKLVRTKFVKLAHPLPTPKPTPRVRRSRVLTPLSWLGRWEWESGFHWDPIAQAEGIRDWNLRAMYGAWDALKNVDKLYPTYKIGRSTYLAGKRESRRLLGDVILTEADFRNAVQYADACFPCTWSIDVHYPDKRFREGFEGKEFLATSNFLQYAVPYWVPYRCLYSRNINNLFMAGRDISVTHMALGPVRVMKTIGMGGEIVGMAASICIKHDVLPRGVYQQYIPELKALMIKGVGIQSKVESN